MSGGDIDVQELQRRVLHALGQPLVRLAHAFATPLADTLTGLRLSYFHHLKGTGSTLKEIAEHLGISERQAKRLQQQLREAFLDVEQEHSLPVRIEFMLWATPMSRARLKQVLSDVTAADIDRAVDTLLEDGRVVEQPGRTRRLAANRQVNSLVRDTWLARIGGLTSLLANLADVVYGRFFTDEPRAFARTMTFLVREEDVAELERHFAEALVPALAAIDARAKSEGGGRPLRLSLMWAPFDAIDTQPSADSEADSEETPQ